jgi:hypothetical protein
LAEFFNNGGGSLMIGLEVIAMNSYVVLFYEVVLFLQ